MTSSKTTSGLDLHARAAYHDAQHHLSARTIAELNRRRIITCNNDLARQHPARREGWPLGAVLGGVCALALGLLLWTSRQEPAAISESFPMATLDATDARDAVDALDAINLTALDEDFDFFLWLTSQEASLLAME